MNTFEEKFGGGIQSGLVPCGTVPYRKINLQVPVWVDKRLQEEADRANVSKESLINIWLVGVLDMKQ